MSVTMMPARADALAAALVDAHAVHDHWQARVDSARKAGRALYDSSAPAWEALRVAASARDELARAVWLLGWDVNALAVKLGVELLAETANGGNAPTVWTPTLKRAVVALLLDEWAYYVTTKDQEGKDDDE